MGALPGTSLHANPHPHPPNRPPDEEAPAPPLAVALHRPLSWLLGSPSTPGPEGSVVLSGRRQGQPGRPRAVPTRPPLAPTAARQAGLSRAAACRVCLGSRQGGFESLPEDVFSARVGSRGVGAGRPRRNVAGQRGSLMALGPHWPARPGTGWGRPSPPGGLGLWAVGLGQLPLLPARSSLPPTPQAGPWGLAPGGDRGHGAIVHAQA